MKNKIILYLGGGVMSGVFSGGVLCRLEELNFYPHIEAIFAGSAGAINAAYFLAHQSQLGATIYFEDLNHRFILPWNIPLGIIQRLWNRYVRQLSTERMRNAINIDYLFEVISSTKKLDILRIQQQQIGFYVKLLNCATGETVYTDAKIHNLLPFLKAAVAAIPYYFSVQMIEGVAYMDGMIKEQLGLTYLLQKYPEHKIVVLFNSSVRRGTRHYLKNFLEGLVAELHPHQISLSKLFREKERLLRRDISLALHEERILFICPPENNPTLPSTIDPRRLRVTFEMGKQEVNKILNFIKYGFN